MSIVATFEITYTQYLDHNGEVQQPLPEFAKNNDTLIDLYKIMVQIRAYDVKAVALQRTGNMSTYAQIYGQEAISTAIGYAMRPEDVLIPYYRDYAAQLQRGVKMSEIYGFWGGDESGSNFANNRYDLPMSVPIASQSLHAAGVATALKLRKEPRVAVTTIGDGGTSEGDFYEALNISGAWHLPLVFVINNNKWAISLPINKQTGAKTLAQKAIAGGIRGCQVDGNDVIAVLDVFGKALDAARNGEGACLIEALSYRLCDHTTADDASRYRPKTEFDEAAQYEPIRRLQRYLLNTGCWNESLEAQLQQECAINVQNAVTEYLNMPLQPIASMFDYHYETLPHDLQEQRAQAIKEAANA